VKWIEPTTDAMIAAIPTVNQSVAIAPAKPAQSAPAID
jgi:hypothetical protein